LLWQALYYWATLPAPVFYFWDKSSLPPTLPDYPQTLDPSASASKVAGIIVMHHYDWSAISMKSFQEGFTSNLINVPFLPSERITCQSTWGSAEHIRMLPLVSVFNTCWGLGLPLTDWEE
jgi:hypothetical protein